MILLKKDQVKTMTSDERVAGLHAAILSVYENKIPGGFLIIDDYGHWSGCQKAVDEFFGLHFVEKNFTKLDYTGIMFQKL